MRPLSSLAHRGSRCLCLCSVPPWPANTWPQLSFTTGDRVFHLVPLRGNFSCLCSVWGNQTSVGRLHPTWSRISSSVHSFAHASIHSMNTGCALCVPHTLTYRMHRGQVSAPKSGHCVEQGDEQ